MNYLNIGESSPEIFVLNTLALIFCCDIIEYSRGKYLHVYQVQRQNYNLRYYENN